ncbi:hypothetical protein ES705_51031 [subsurface metagenome]
MLAGSWLQPPPLEIKNGYFINEGYDFTQRAYVLNSADNKPGNLEVELFAGNDSPMVNICLVINGWETDDITVQLNDKELQENKDYRIGKRRGLEREDLIVWIDHESIIPSRIMVKANIQ